MIEGRDRDTSYLETCFRSRSIEFFNGITWQHEFLARRLSTRIDVPLHAATLPFNVTSISHNFETFAEYDYAIMIDNDVVSILT